MATRWRGWTRRPAVKTASFLLVLACLAAQLVATAEMIVFVRSDEFADYGYYGHVSEEDYVRWNLYETMNWAMEVALFQSEEVIRDGVLLQESYSPSGDLTGLTCRVTGTELAERYFDLYIEVEEPDEMGEWEYWGYNISSNPKEAVTMAIQQQLDLFRRAQMRMEHTECSYRIVSGGNVYSNVDRMENMAYIMEYTSGRLESDLSDWDDWEYDYAYDKNLLTEVYPNVRVGMDASLFAQRQAQSEASRLAVRDYLGQTAAFVSVGLIALVILTLGAGRRREDGGLGVHLGFWDTVYLDLGLFLILAFTSFLFGAFMGLRSWIGLTLEEELISIAVGLTLAGGVPGLVWYISLVKRMKAGKWWRHTLCYSICHGFVELCGRTCRRAGEAMERLRATRRKDWLIISCVGCILMFFFSAVLPLFFLIPTIFVCVELYRTNRTVEKLEEGARQVELGDLRQPITGVRGYFSGLADAINHISSGLDEAVHKQLQSERMKTELITNVSHDLRTPLTSLVTYTDLLKTEGLDSEHAPEYLEVLIQKTSRLRTLTDELFEAAKAASGSLEVNLEPLDFCQLIRQCLGELDEKVQSAELDFRLSLPESAIVHADGRMLWRVMENLLSNTFKYALRGSRVYLSLQEEGDKWRMEMKNISHEALNMEPWELTERFKRGDASRNTEGSGLGLSIVQSFVEAQGGSFRLEIDGDLFKALVLLDQAGQ